MDCELLFELAKKQYHLDPESVHGPAHWRRVEKVGLFMAKRTGAHPIIVRLFAMFHDCCRLSDDTDAGHGFRGGQFAQQLRGKAIDIPDDQFALLYEACVGHADGRISNDPTIGTCWDADRLDLGRVGIIPEPTLMSTAFGKEIAHSGSIYPFLSGGDARNDK